VERLQQFNYESTMHYIKGKKNIVNVLFHHPLANAISMVKKIMMEDIKKIMFKMHVSNSLMKTCRKTHKEIQKYMAYILDNRTYLLYYDTSV
jgi:hypothetical protein